MKKRLIIEVVCGVVIFVIGYFIGDSSAISRVNKTIDTNIQKESSSKNETKSSAQKDNKEKKNDPKVYKLGEDGKSGGWQIKVLDAKETNIVKGKESDDDKKTKDKFIVVKLQMKNISKQPIQYSSNEFMLGNMKDNSQYSINDNAFEALQTANSNETIYKENGNFVGVYTDINPSTTKQTYVVFEVPKDMKLSDTILINANNELEPVGFNLK